MLYFIGLGPGGFDYITLKGLKKLKEVDVIYLDSYTSIVPKQLVSDIENILDKKVIEVNRRKLENEGYEILVEAKEKEVAILVPGDPMIATTHRQLRIEAKKLGVETRVIYGVSILTAAISAVGLHVYKFGASATIPLNVNECTSNYPYMITAENIKRGLHTLLYLEATPKDFVDIRKAIQYLLTFEEIYKKKVLTEDRILVGIARLTYEDEIIMAGNIHKILQYNFGGPPHLLIITGKLHFTELDCLRLFAHLEEDI